ncbi:hypothetical protein ACIQPR_48445 [Streptomyces sp. NPDC091280]|uniref:hypothetical protein n=1 Tax=Streptomyces sp. NPDC091280 TaxID=3365984 RepID=UPI0037F35423
MDQPEVHSAREPFSLDDLQRLIERLEIWLPVLFQALRAVGSEELEAAEKIQSATQAISSECALLAATPRLRPWMPIIEYAETCVSHLVQMVRSYLQSLGATTPLEAQRKAEEAQGYLNTAALEMAALTRFIDILDRLVAAERAEEKMMVLIQQAQRDLNVSDITALSLIADQSLAHVIQASKLPNTGLGLQFALQDIAARFYGDQHRFRDLVSKSYTLLSGNPALLSAVASSPDFLPDLQEGLLELNDAATQVMHAINGQSLTRQVGRAIVDVAASLVEGPGQLVAAALLAGTGRKTRPYDKLRQDNATDLLRSARNHPDLEPLVRGFSQDLRTAQAHRMVRYADDGITLETKGGSGKLTWHELGDQVFTAYESAMGCLVGMQVALAESGISTYGPEFYKSFGISAAGMAEIGLVAEGCDITSFIERPDSWTVELTPPPDAKLFQLAGGIASLIPDEVLTLTLIANGDSRNRVFDGPVEPLRAFSLGDVDDDSYGMATVRALHLWKYDGVRCLTSELMRRWTAYQVHLARLDSTCNPIPRIRALRALALEINDRELAEVLTAAMRSSRLGGDADARTTTLEERLSSWGAASVKFDFP